MVFMSYLPPRLVGFLELVGYKFDRVQGMAMLQQCAANDGYFSGTAAAMMCAAYLIKARFSFNDGEAEDAYMEKALELASTLVERWPNNPLASWLQSQIFRLTGNLDS